MKSALYGIIISIHAPREGGDLDFLGTVLDFIISIHAPREGGDVKIVVTGPRASQFQSTPPARGATRYPVCLINCVKISIHAPREGGEAKMHSFICESLINK